MAEYIHLIGAEDVRLAGTRIQTAASEMTRAASIVEDSLARHRTFLDDWLLRLEEMIGRKIEERRMEDKCEFYPGPDDGCVCAAGSDISGYFFCTKEYSDNCQWAEGLREMNRKEVKNGG